MNSGKPSCVLIGGGGFIGTNLSRHLMRAGFRVRAFGRRCLFPDAMEGAEWFPGDFRDTAALASAIQSFDVVVHLVHSTVPQTANLDQAGDLQNNLLPSLALMDLCRNVGVSRIVFVSSGGTVYGRPQQIPTPETAATDPITAYGISKLAIEKYLALNEHLYGTEYRVLRVANPFGPFQLPHKSQGFVATVISRALNSEAIDIWGDGTVVRDFLYIDDVSHAVMAAISDGGGERIFNIGSGKGLNLLEVVAAVERRLGQKLTIEFHQSRVVDVPASVLAVGRATEHLHWTPATSFDDGLEKTIAWWRNRA